MASPPSAINQAMTRGLEREDKVTRLLSYSRWIIGLLAFLMIVAILQSVRNSGASTDPFHVSFLAITFPLLAFLLGINIFIFTEDYLELRWTTNPKMKVWRSEDFMVNARPIIVISIIMAIFFSAPAIIGMFEDISTNRGDETIAEGGDFRVKFSPKDPLEISYVEAIEVNSERGPVTVYIIEEKDYAFIQSSEYNFSDPSVAARVKWSYPSESNTITEKINELALTQVQHALVMRNNGNESITVHYKLINRVDKNMTATLTVLCASFFGANLGWAIGCFLLKRRFVAEFILVEQQKLMRTYTIEEVFLIYKDGRLISHNSRRLKPDVDKDILTGMLTAVQSFVKDSFAGEEKGILNELKYGNLKILIENGQRANLAVVISGVEPQSLRANMRAMLSGIHQKYMGILDDWDGEVGRLKDIKKQIGQLIPEEKQRPRTVVEELLLFYRDSRFMMHTTQRGQPDVDDTLLASLLETVRAKVSENMNSASVDSLYDFPYGNWRVFVEYGVQLYIAVLVSGPVPEDLRPRMRSLIAHISTKHETMLAQWDGTADKILELKPELDIIFLESIGHKKKR